MVDFVKIILTRNEIFDFALRKRRFCNAKQPLLPCKTYAFGMQNNRFYNTLIIKELNNSYACEKYLQPYCFLFAHKTSCCDKFMLYCNDACIVTAKPLQGSIKRVFGQSFLSATAINR